MTARSNVYDLHGSAFLNTLSSESFGGNAGGVTVDGKRFTCAAVNGFAEKETGRFVTFGNFQNLDPAIVRNPDYDEMSITVGHNFGSLVLGTHLETKIIDLITSEQHGFQPEALEAMLGAVALYNEFEAQR